MSQWARFFVARCDAILTRPSTGPMTPTDLARTQRQSAEHTAFFSSAVLQTCRRLRVSARDGPILTAKGNRTPNVVPRVDYCFITISRDWGPSRELRVMRKRSARSIDAIYVQNQTGGLCIFNLRLAEFSEPAAVC